MLSLIKSVIRFFIPKDIKTRKLYDVSEDGSVFTIYEESDNIKRILDKCPPNIRYLYHNNPEMLRLGLDIELHNREKLGIA